MNDFTQEPQPQPAINYHTVRDRNGERVDVAGYHDAATGRGWIVIGDASVLHTLDVTAARTLAVALIVALGDASVLHTLDVTAARTLAVALIVALGDAEGGEQS